MLKKTLNAKTLLLVLALALIVAGYGIYYSFNRSRQASQGQNTTAQQEITKVVAAVGELMELPANETPSLATVTNKEALSKTQLFFASAENGDKLLIYAKAMKAILYRPSTDKIIEVEPIVLNNGAGAQPVAPQKPLKIAYYNGTETAGITAGAEEKIQKFFGAQGLTTTVSKDNAAKKDYQGALVVDLTGNNATSTEVIAAFLGGKAGPLPAGEAKPEADVLIILGK